MRTGIIGAGIAGLTLATRLEAAGFDVVLHDKSRGVGGRLATRYTDHTEFDHGAQFFTARTPAFQAFLAPHLETGLVAEWQPNITTIDPAQAPYTRPWYEPHYVSAPRMTSLGKQLIAKFDARLGDAVSECTFEKGDWQVRTASGEHSSYDFLVSTAPSVQTEALLPLQFDGVVFDPCFALMCELTEMPAWDAAVVKHPDVSWLARTESRPGRGRPGLVLHSTGDFARTHLEDEPEAVRTTLLERLSTLTGLVPSASQLHRWRYARVIEPVGEPCYFNAVTKLGACGDWFIGGRVEDAFTSASTLADEMVAKLRP